MFIYNRINKKKLGSKKSTFGFVVFDLTPLYHHYITLAAIVH